MQAPSQDRRKTKPRKEAFFVAIKPKDADTVTFFNVSEHIGKTMPFEQPKATCAMRASADAISFSLLHLTNRSAANIVAAPIAIPHGPLARLERKASQLADITTEEVVVEYGTDEEGKALTHRMKISRDDNNVATLEMAEGDDLAFELPKSAVNLSIYLKSPAVNRTMGVGFIGHLGKPGDDSTLTRAVSMALFSLSQLTEFRILSGIETVDVPVPPARSGARRQARLQREKAQHMVPTRLFSADMQPVGDGHVVVEVDLEHANSNTSRLLFLYTPSPELAEAFPAYRDLYDRTVADLVTRALGADDVAAITFEVVLGEVESGTIERLKDALRTIAGLDLNPAQFRLHDAAA